MNRFKNKRFGRMAQTHLPAGGVRCRFIADRASTIEARHAQTCGLYWLGGEVIGACFGVRAARAVRESARARQGARLARMKRNSAGAIRPLELIEELVESSSFTILCHAGIPNFGAVERTVDREVVKIRLLCQPNARMNYDVTRAILFRDRQNPDAVGRALIAIARDVATHIPPDEVDPLVGVLV